MGNVLSNECFFYFRFMQYVVGVLLFKEIEGKFVESRFTIDPFILSTSVSIDSPSPHSQVNHYRKT